MLQICHAGLQWRTELKQAICDHLREWGLCPSLTEIELKKLTTVNIRSHIVVRVKDFLLNVNFCDSVIDAQV